MDWLKEINAAVTICNNHGIIVYMNEKSEKVFKNDGGKDLLGKSLFDCHPEPALTKLKEMLNDGSTNVYTIEKNGRRKLFTKRPGLKKMLLKEWLKYHTRFQMKCSILLENNNSRTLY